MTFDPWQVLASTPDLTVARAPLPEGERGRFYPDQDVILLSDRLSQAERRSTLTHELVHRQRGHRECAALELAARQEARCEQEAARHLIALGALADSLLAECDLDQVADELCVDLETLTTRLAHLHPSERGYLQRRLSMKEHTA